MKRILLIVTGLLILFASEILRVYFIMPFPGSQRADTINIAYFISKYIWWFRVAGLLLLIPSLLYIFRNGRLWKKILLSFFVLLYVTVFYMFNFKFLADKMFYQPQNKILATVQQNKIDSTKLIIGVTINGQSKAYPIEIIGYHHQVRDTVGGEPVMVTYCTVCRTGRVYSPVLNGKPEQFRLVGMDHFNAMFEDATTKSWWRQATGLAVAGPLEGTQLPEIASAQMSLKKWMLEYPNTLIMQPDPLYAKQYKDLEGFNEGTINSGLEKRDNASWQFKSWVVGIVLNKLARAYDWNDLVNKRIINDSFPARPVVLVLEKDKVSFHAFHRTWLDGTLDFEMDSTGNYMKDLNSGSVWTFDGTCIEGKYKSEKLISIPAYQEFWHSWQTFHPATTKYLPE